MSFKDLALKRQSYRKFLEKPVEKEKLEQIVEIAHYAPSACNSQPWKMHVVCEPEMVKDLSACLRDFGMNQFTKEVPAFIVVSEVDAKLAVGSKLKYDNNHFVKYDVGQLIAYITLAAEDLGLSTCILGWLNNKKIASLLNFEENELANVVIAVGYSEAPTRQKVRKEIDSITCWH